MCRATSFRRLVKFRIVEVGNRSALTPARNERLHVVEPNLLERIPKLSYRQTPLAKIYSTEKSNVSLHGRSTQT